jgi:LPS O-antigen subunit length determinant protein (WzzB/FepE family)
MVRVSIDWTDAELASAWVTRLIEQLNQYLRLQAIARSESNLKYLNEELARTQVEEMRKTLFDLIGQEQKNAMLANAQREFAFRVLDPSVVPDKKVKPKRALIVVLAAIAALLVSMLTAFVLNQREE